MNQKLTVIGVMSGTSLDGLDLCCVRFWRDKEGCAYEIVATDTLSYSDSLKDDLERTFHMTQGEQAWLDKNYGGYIGKCVADFIHQNQLKGKVDFVGSHGHTIWHQPEKGVTVQIGDGQCIADECGLPTYYNFRVKDVELGGQGAPLVPIGDRLLFSEFESCMNLGGIANISFEKDGERIAFDIGPANMPLNELMREHFDTDVDWNGDKAKSGKNIPELRLALSRIPFYKQAPPKSLGKEWFVFEFEPVLKRFEDERTEDVLRTIVEHETDVIADCFEKYQLTSCLITGGGAYNKFFIERLSEKTTTELILPKAELIEFKEALIFAFLAYLNHLGEVNTLASVTGAKSDSIGGFLCTPRS